MFTMDIKKKKKWLIALTFIVLLGVASLIFCSYKTRTVSVVPILDDVQTVRDRLTDLSENTRSNIRKEVAVHEKEIKEDIKNLPSSTLVDRLNALIEE